VNGAEPVPETRPGTQAADAMKGGKGIMNGADETKLYGTEELAEAIRWDATGLVPAVVQDAASREVLMLAYMNRESLAKTLESGETWFWSRSRGELWHKGATSGHLQKVRRIRYDCDADTILVEVDQAGAACHTGRQSCFYRELDLKRGQSLFYEGKEDPKAILDKLEALIAERDEQRPEGAYTTYLFEHGVDKILKKVGEEASEVIIAAKNRSKHELRYEAADLLYHLLVLLREQGMRLDEVLEELASRHLKKKGEYPSLAGERQD
jgi:phosphoribosyl-ATP pyrophosphohydrolase/phosphoribosyl-AMP cyclohydrolase